jgi:large subunit ribosomal protein L22
MVDSIRGLGVEEALNQLRFFSSPAARYVARTVQSASANAESNYQLDPGTLRVTRIFVDEGVTVRRFRPRARGQATAIRRRSSHITVMVEDQEESLGS